MSCLFTKPFDNVDVPLIFIDMILWVGAEEALKILKLPHQALSSLPQSEKSTLKQLEPCSETCKLFITALGVGLLTSRLVTRGCLVNDTLSNDNRISERANTFANMFLSDVISEIRVCQLLCGISVKEDEILNLLNET